MGGGLRPCNMMQGVQFEKQINVFWAYQTSELCQQFVIESLSRNQNSRVLSQKKENLIPNPTEICDNSNN